MKINKQIIAVAVLGLCAVSARASWTIDSVSTEVVSLNQSGSSAFTFTQSGVTGQTIGSFENFAITGQIPFQSSSLTAPFGIFSSFSIVSITGGGFTPNNSTSLATEIADGGKVTENTPFTVTVDWTVNNTSLPGAQTTLGAAFEGGSPDPSEAASTSFSIATVPEPSQSLAGAMLLGCGGLVFASRRLLKKQTS